MLIRKPFSCFEILFNFSSSLSPIVDYFCELIGMSKNEIWFVGSVRKFFNEIRFVLFPKSSHFLYISKSSKLFKVFLVMAKFRIVPHQVFSKVNARVESVLDALIYFSFVIFLNSFDFFWQFFKSWNKYWKNVFCEMNVKVIFETTFSLIWKRNIGACVSQ